MKPLNPKLRFGGDQDATDSPFDQHIIWNGADFKLWTPDFDIDLLSKTQDFASYEAALPHSIIIATSGGRSFRILSLDAALRIGRHRNRIDDQLALPEKEALIEIRDLKPHIWLR